MSTMNPKRRKFLLLILICFLILLLIAAGIFFGVRSVKRVIAQAGLANALTLKTTNFPVVDGTYFMQAFGEATGALLTETSIITARENVLFTGPESAKDRLLSGEADIIIVSETDAADVTERAAEEGIELIYYTIAKDGLVLCADEEYGPTDITSEEFNQVYETYVTGLSSSTYCYALSSWSAKGKHLLTVDGIAPNERTIADGTYPFSYNVCVVLRSGGIASNPQRVVAWMLGQEGQSTLTNLGYINNTGSPIAEGAGANAYTYYATRNETSVESTGIRVIKGAEGYPVTEGTTTNYLTENPIIWSSIKKEKGTIGEISGLTNETVPKAINDRILSAYSELAALEIPEFRGIRLSIPIKSLLIQTEVTASILYNYNSVVSIRMQGDYTFALPDENGVIRENAWGYYETTETLTCCDYLNFDLNTGRELSLENLFVDGCDYRDLVSSLIVSNPDFSEYFILTGSYKEARSDQKFYLQGDAIYLVFDQDAPEFILREPHEYDLVIYFADIVKDLAITSRYYSEEESPSLYTAQSTDRRVLIPNRDELDVNGSREVTYGNVKITEKWSYSSLLPSYGKNRINEARTYRSAVASSLNKADKQATYQITTTASRQNNYLSVFVSDYRWQEGAAEKSSARYYCYDIDAMNEASLRSLFWAGFDYDPVIRSELAEEVALRGGFVTQMSDGPVPWTEAETEKEINRLINELVNFAIDYRSLYVSFESLPLADGSDCIALQIPFAEFGSANITLFR